jgi:hypothetical protein
MTILRDAWKTQCGRFKLNLCDHKSEIEKFELMKVRFQREVGVMKTNAQSL